MLPFPQQIVCFWYADGILIAPWREQWKWKAEKGSFLVFVGEYLGSPQFLEKQKSPS